MNRHPAIGLDFARLQRFRIGVQRRASLVGGRGVGHQQEAEAVGDVERLLGVEAQAAHHVRSADVQLLGLGKGPVGFLGRAQQVLLHHLVFASTASGGLHPVGHLPVGIDLLDDAANDACPGHGGEGATDQHAGLLRRATRAVER